MAIVAISKISLGTFLIGCNRWFPNKNLELSVFCKNFYITPDFKIQSVKITSCKQFFCIGELGR